MADGIRILNCSDAPNWNWIAGAYTGPTALAWRAVSTRAGPLLARAPGPNWGRLRAGLEARLLLAATPVDLVVSHGPHTTYAVEAIARPRRPHLAWSFNFTDLPTGRKLERMRRSFAGVERFIVFSRMERELYADLFGLPVDRFRFVHWGVNPPLRELGPRVVEGAYAAALGGEARDYATLCAAARLLPSRRFVVVARPHSLHGVEVPDNVSVFTDLPFERAWSIVGHARVALVPLRSATTPNGHVTIVGSMHLGKALVATDSAGIRDYLAHDETALLVKPGDPHALRDAVERVMDDEALAERLGGAARLFARRWCSEEATVSAFRDQLRDLLGRA